ncbi:hypothetical protein BH20GEM2_BH20GEM2_13490 [soil metagenome]
MSSDLDILLVFRALPPDREPQAESAEAVACRVAGRWGIPLEVWSVSLEDLKRGRRTPMLVDALDDGIPIFPPGSPPLLLPLTPADARWCRGALLARVAEGSIEVAELRAAARNEDAARRVRDDVVRLCTAQLLLRGMTRPRRGDAVRAYLAAEPAGWSGTEHATFRWAAQSFAGDERDDESAPAPPPGGLDCAGRLVDRLRERVRAERHRSGGTFAAFEGFNQARSTPDQQPRK